VSDVARALSVDIGIELYIKNVIASARHERRISRLGAGHSHLYLPSFSPTDLITAPFHASKLTMGPVDMSASAQVG
jgi:hypothetical protein